MALEKLLSITGKPGLYELKTQTRSGFLATSLLDGKTISIGARHNVSLLSEIAIYTLKEEVPLRDVFQKIKEKEDGGKAINHKEDKIKLEEYFFEVLPDYDEDRVYASDIKKIVQWYNLLHDNDMLNFEEEANEETKEQPKAQPAKTKSKPTNTGGNNAKTSSAKKGGATKNPVARKS